MLKKSSDLWNQISLETPPLVTFDYSLNEYNHLFSCTDYHLLFEQNLNKLIHLFKNSPLDDEQNLFEKLIFKNWNPLRKEISMQLMRQLKRLLTKWKQIKLNDLAGSIKEMSISKQESIKKLPSKEVFEYFLVRLQSAFNLADYIESLIKNKLFIHLMKLIHNAIYLANNILFVSTVSRLYFILKKFKNITLYVYNSLRSYIHLFKSTSIQWSSNFTIDKLPPKLAFEKKIEQNLQIEKKIFSFVDLNQEEDIGVRIERVEVTQSNESEFSKWKKLLLKSINKSIELKNFKKEFRKFLYKKYKISNADYIQFLNELLNKKSICITDLNGKKKKKFLKIIYKTITKFIQNKSLK